MIQAHLRFSTSSKPEINIKIQDDVATTTRKKNKKQKTTVARAKMNNEFTVAKSFKVIQFFDLQVMSSSYTFPNLGKDKQVMWLKLSIQTNAGYSPSATAVLLAKIEAQEMDSGADNRRVSIEAAMLLGFNPEACKEDKDSKFNSRIRTSQPATTKRKRLPMPIMETSVVVEPEVALALSLVVEEVAVVVVEASVAGVAGVAEAGVAEAGVAEAEAEADVAVASFADSFDSFDG
jgi:hypothetical protein